MEKKTAPSGNRFRRWIFAAGIVFAVAFLTPFFVPDPAPPFKFLKKAELQYLRVRDDEGKVLAYTSYMVRGPWTSVRQSAEAELQGWSHGKDATGADEFVSAERRVTVVDYNFGSEQDPWTRVLYDYPPRLIDRIRYPVYEIKSLWH